MPGKAPNPAKRVENAAYEAEKAGGNPADYVRTFKEMNQNKLPADVLADVKGITHGTPGSKAAATASKLANKAADMSGLGAGFASGDPVTGVLTAMGLHGLGAASKFAAGQGTKESVEALRRKLLNIPEFQGPMTAEMRDKLARLTRGGILSATE